MPCRRGLGALAHDQKASYAHGRLELRRVITEQQCRALDDLARDIARAWRVQGVAKPSVRAMDLFRVVGLDTIEIDEETATRWKQRWRDARSYLIARAGLAPFGVLVRVVAFDDEDVDHRLLHVGANAAVAYYMLTRKS